MSALHLMQARSTTSGQMVTWTSDGPDWAGASFPGPGSPEFIAVNSAPEQCDPLVSISAAASTSWEDNGSTGVPNAKLKVPARRKQTATSTNAANQVLDDGGVYSGYDMTLPPAAMVKIVVTILLKRNGADDAGEIDIVGRFYRHGTGNPQRIGSDENSGATYLTSGLAGVTADLNIDATNKRVQVRISPGSTLALDIGVTRVQYVRLS